MSSSRADPLPDSVTDQLVISTPEGIQLTQTLAGLGSRYLARLLDWLIRIVLLWAALVAFRPLAGNGLALAVLWIVYFVLFLLYDIISELVGKGRTIGKMAAGIRVVRVDSRPIDLWSSVVRNLLRLVDEIISLGLAGTISIFASRRGQRLGDLAAGTVVVRERSFTAAADPLPAWAEAADAPFLEWDTSGVTGNQLALARAFIARRSMLRTDARARLAAELASDIRPLVPAEPGWNDEQFLVSVVAARMRRART